MNGNTRGPLPGLQQPGINPQNSLARPPPGLLRPDDAPQRNAASHFNQQRQQNSITNQGAGAMKGTVMPPPVQAQADYGSARGALSSDPEGSRRPPDKDRLMELINHRLCSAGGESTGANSRKGVRKEASKATWMYDLENYLSQEKTQKVKSSTASNGASPENKLGCTNSRMTQSRLTELSKNREGINVSLPFRLTSEGYPALVMAVNQAKMSPPKEHSGKESGQNKCVLECFDSSVQQISSENVRDSSMVFQWEPHSKDHDESQDYVPIGYEEFEKETPNGDSSPNKNMFLLEISTRQHTNNNKHDTVQLMDVQLALPGADHDEACVFEDSISISVIPLYQLCELASTHKTFSSFLDEIDKLEEYDSTTPFNVGRGYTAWSGSLVVIVAQRHSPSEQIASRSAARGEKDTGSLNVGSMVTKFCRFVEKGHFASTHQSTDAFSAYLSFASFMIGRTMILERRQDFPENEESTKEEVSLSSRELLKLSLLNADRFVPAHKQQQWDNMPQLLLSVQPYQYLGPDFRHWLLDPAVRR
jgi:hypothetical protein